MFIYLLVNSIQIDFPRELNQSNFIYEPVVIGIFKNKEEDIRANKKDERQSFYAGCQFVDIEDQGNEHGFPLLIMYPTYKEEKVEKMGPYTISAAQDAPLSDGLFPLVIISHGDGSTPLAYRTIAQFLARNGFIVGVPQHPFNNREDNTLSGTIDNLKNRPNHIRTVIDWF